MESYNPLLMVKEPGGRGLLARSEAIMTHADLPSIVTADWENPVNPWSLRRIETEKEGGVTVVHEASSQVARHGLYEYNLREKRTFLGPDILKALSWGPWEKAE
jgi:hypothetical protein